MNTQPAAELHYPRLEAVLNAVAQWITKYRSARQSQSEFSKCGAGEVARIAYDMGVSPRELAEIATKGPGSTALLGKMLATLGVDAEKLAAEKPGVMRDLCRLCITCATRQQCIHEFAAGTAGEHFRDFCPNAYTLDALLQQQKKH